MTAPGMQDTSQIRLYEALEAISAQDPERVALMRGEEALTRGDLARRATAFCDELRDAGLVAGDHVAVVLGNGPEFVIAAFGIWKLGAVVLPLHVRFQEEEILRYVGDCSARAIVTTVRMEAVVRSIQSLRPGVEHAWLCPPDGGTWRHVSGTPGATSPGSESPPRVDTDWTMPALTQYSTGSTGSSKRVTRSHGDLIGEFRAVSEVLKLDQDDRILGVAPFFHAYGLMNGVICGTLSGALVHTLEDFFPRDVARLVESAGITGFPGVPFMHELLAGLPGRSDFSSLRYVLSAGAPLAASTANAFSSRFGIPIRQLYGSTETGVISIASPDADPTDPPHVGSPIPGVTVRITSEQGHELPAGTEGQVAVMSPYAASGYDNVSGVGESYFRDETFFPGDLGVLDAKGQLVLIGRKRQFINVAGNKVDPVEVETALREMQGIAEAVVVGVPDGAAGERIKAVLVAKAPCTREQVIEHCAGRLADFKRPRVVEFRKEIPKSPLGKILKKYLVEDYDETRAMFEFDPRFGFGARSGGSAGSPLAIDLSSVQPFLRALLVTDGTVTKNLEAYFWEPIDIELLFHEREESEHEYPAIELDRGRPIVRRRVILRGRLTGSAYAVAETVIAVDKISNELAHSLVTDRKGIGELLRAGRLETYRELVSVEQGLAGEWAGHLGIEVTGRIMRRTYRIHLGGEPAMQIEEVFAVDRFPG